MPKKKDLTGQKFGRLTVIKEQGRNKNKKVLWLCRCECGTEIVVIAQSLTSGATLSCGCYHKDKLKEQWKDEEYRQTQSEQRRSLNEEMWKDEDFRQKMKESNIGENNPMYGKHHTEETKKIWSQQRTGSLNPNYNPLLSEKDRTRLGHGVWAKQVKEKADYTCNLCGRRGVKLNSHHLNSYNSDEENRNNIDNGVCLCEECHRKFHNKYGYGNNTKEQFEEFKNNDDNNGEAKG